MSDRTKIEWTAGEDGSLGATWNPVRGCVKISPGCKHCYAETFAERWRGVKGHPYEQGFDLRIVPHKLREPLRWQRPRLIFVNSMSDLFQEPVPFKYIAATYGVMAACPRHVFQVLTKRPELALRWYEQIRTGDLREHIEVRTCALALAQTWPDVAGVDTMHTELVPAIESSVQGKVAWPLPNVWVGVSVEDRRYGLPRIDVLREIPAALRFLSIEPLLEDIGELDLTGIGWVIVGGESGPKARPMHLQWARNVRDQCLAAHVPFFFKQWGEYRGIEATAVGDNIKWEPPIGFGNIRRLLRWEGDGYRGAGEGESAESFLLRPGFLSDRVGTKAAGHLLDGVEYRQMPEGVTT